MNKARDVANRVVNVVLASIAVAFAGGMVVYLICAAYVWLFTDGTAVWAVARAVGCLVGALVFKFLSRLDEYEFAPTRTTTTRRPATRRPTRKA